MNNHTSDLSKFQEQLNNPNKHFPEFGSPGEVSASNIIKINKNLIVSFCSGASGSDHIRNIWWLTYLQAVYSKENILRTFITPFFSYSHEMLIQARTLFFPRTMSEGYMNAVTKYKELQKRYGYKMIYDIDDFIWGGDTSEEKVPEYNFGAYSIPKEVVNSIVNIMGLTDLICVSTEFLKNYIEKKLKIDGSKIKILPNCVQRYFYGPNLREPIKEKIRKPKILYSGAPCHYNNEKLMYGDFDNAWREFISKAVTDGKIEFMCMGCSDGDPPWFWRNLKGKPNFYAINWQNSWQYHIPILEFKPDISIRPLIPNYFNYSKSDIGYLESCACGAAFIGTVFSNGMPSPYDGCFIKLLDNCTVSQIEDKISEITEPEAFNSIIQKQWDFLEEDGRWMESKKYISRLLEIF